MLRLVTGRTPRGVGGGGGRVGACTHEGALEAGGVVEAAPHHQQTALFVELLS